MEIEKLGIPTVAIVAKGFEHDFEIGIKSQGLNRIAYTTVSRALTNATEEDIRDEIKGCTDGIINGLTQEAPGIEKKEVARTKVIRVNGVDLLDAWGQMNELFLRYGWSDGFPLVPPTREKVQDMLAATKRSPEEVVCNLSPGGRPATIEKIAINAVMAGCLSSHLPVVIAAVEALSSPVFGGPGIAMSTGPHARMVIVNGPIAKKLNINCGRGALGPGAPSFANTVIGRAVRLILMNIGQAYVGQMDLSTIGSPNKYSMCIAENEEMNPWEPLHVERGFLKEESTVTVYGAESQLEVMNQVSTTPEDLMRTFTGTANTAGNGGTGSYMRKSHNRRNNLMLIAPDHAALFAKYGWSKQDVKEYMCRHAQIQWRYLKNAQGFTPARTKPSWNWIWDAPEDTWLPIAGGPDWFQIVVVGGPAGKSSYITGEQIVTKKIQDFTDEKS
ncbi:hypothetical protein ACFLVJ_03550 [Chloroflexota bacterium]